MVALSSLLPEATAAGCPSLHQRMFVALATAQWVVTKALGPVADGVLGAWAATRNFGPNIEALSTELLLVKATLEQAALKELSGPAMEMLLQKLQDLAHNAEDLLDELDYFRIHCKLHKTYDAADQHGKGGVHDLALNVHHTAKAVGKSANCCPWQRAKRKQRTCGDSFSAPNTNQKLSRCMPKLGILLPCSSSPHTHVGDDDHGNAQDIPQLEFNRVHFSQKMKAIVEKLQLMRNEVNKILQGCGPRIVIDIAQSRPITRAKSTEPKLYGRDGVMNSIIHDITKGQYCDKGLTVLPVVGPGGMGKTTLIQHIYHNQQVQNHFSVKIWICVSFNFNLDKISNGDDWKKLLLTLGQSQEKGSMILVTTRLKNIAEQVKTIDRPKELYGLEHEEFKKLFLAFVFDDGKYPRNKPFLLEIGDQIMDKLKGSPLAAKTVGRLLSKELSLQHWKGVLKCKEWEKQTDNNEVMPALKLSYDFLPFHLQQCFSYSALFPEDYHFRSHELISLWTGLDILIPCGQHQTFEDVGLSNLNELIIHGFFREEQTDGDRRYVMHDLLHDLALKVASHDCLSLRLPNIGSVEIQPSTRHLSIITEDIGESDATSGEKLKSALEEMKTILEVEHLQTLMLFGKMDESFSKIFGDCFGEAYALRVLYLPNMMHPVESVLHNFSGLFHLRYLCLGTKDDQMHLPLSISKFYHLVILDLELWVGSRVLPEDMSNLSKLCHFYVPSDDQLHSGIYNVGKLKLLEELKMFQVNKKSEGFEPKQLEHLTKLRELGIYNLEKIHTKEEAAQAKLIERKHLRRLKLDWDCERSSVEPGVEAEVLENLQPHGDLQVLCIRGHGDLSCPTWMGDEFAVEALRSLYLDCVSWEVFPSLGKAWDLCELKLKHIARLKEIIIEETFCMLIKLELIGLGSFEKWGFLDVQESSMDADIFPCLQVLIIIDCPKLLGLPFSSHIVSQGDSDCLVGPLGCLGDVEWQLPVEHMLIMGLNCNIGEELTELLPHLPKLSKLDIRYCKNIKQLVVGVDLQQITEMEIRAAAADEDDDGVLLFPAHLCNSLLELEFYDCPELVLVDPPTLVPGGGWLQALRSLQRLTINGSPWFLFTFSFSRHIFPSSLQFLKLKSMVGMGTLKPISNLSCLMTLELIDCGEDLKCQGLQPLLTTRGHINELQVFGSPGFFAGWDPNPKHDLEELLSAPTLQELSTDDIAGLLSAPICNFLSSSLTKLELHGARRRPSVPLLLPENPFAFHRSESMERFSKEQEDALQLLSSLQELKFSDLHKLQQLPAGLCNLTSLEKLTVCDCSVISSLPNDGLPKSLQQLVLYYCSEELKQKFRELVGTIPEITIGRIMPFSALPFPYKHICHMHVVLPSCTKIWCSSVCLAGFAATSVYILSKTHEDLMVYLECLVLGKTMCVLLFIDNKGDSHSQHSAGSEFSRRMAQPLVDRQRQHLLSGCTELVIALLQIELCAEYGFYLMMKYVLLNMDGNALMDIAVYTNAKTQKLRQCADVEEKLRSQRL
ncbi:hypothetical protein CFC21_025318 [Triticum aestivum]|uniref:NB-ARC domain-containing protein n=2 Tax=Triticum aestivum TaxID=4565 RepID=A0A3B6CCK1_WHEAT|nr:hypothetical protein CFC21_025318 [Triticum aestivum]